MVTATSGYPVVFNLTLLGLCLGAMGVGSLLRIRLYLLVGFAGVVVDLGMSVADLGKIDLYQWLYFLTRNLRLPGGTTKVVGNASMRLEATPTYTAGCFPPPLS